MANENYINEDYFCPVCKSFFTATEDLLDEVELTHDCGEHLVVMTIQCPHCESMSIPEGMNQIAWLKKEMNLKS